ncbi:DUF421 domain-containing protein [Pontibacter locisalis]|uniref:DUF421 domain-containing protein n=1 Tax=Pontibacter locisalis TaxID=1719035 RepID=A0ABW5II72_9BACT
MLEFLDTALKIIDTALGIGEDSLSWWQMAIRAVVVFIAALIIVRLGNKRIFGKNTAFDIVLGIIYGSVLSRAITGNSPFWPTIVAAFVLVILHRLLAKLAFHADNGFGRVIKGDPKLLIKEGELQLKKMQEYSVTKHDLEEAIRNTGSVPDFKKVKRAYIERSGDISIVMMEEE